MNFRESVEERGLHVVGQDARQLSEDDILQRNIVGMTRGEFVEERGLQCVGHFKNRVTVTTTGSHIQSHVTLYSNPDQLRVLFQVFGRIFQINSFFTTAVALSRIVTELFRDIF